MVTLLSLHQRIIWYRTHLIPIEWCPGKPPINPFWRTWLSTNAYYNLATLSFYSHKHYKERQAREHEAWLERRREREEKIARGEKVGPEEEDPTAEREVGLLGLLKFIIYLILAVTLAGKFFTGSFLWEYDGKWARLKTYWPVRLVLCTIPKLS